MWVPVSLTGKVSNDKKLSLRTNIIGWNSYKKKNNYISSKHCSIEKRIGSTIFQTLTYDIYVRIFYYM